MQILVTGTTGGIGGAVKAAAHAYGHAVVELNRADFEEWGPAAGRDPSRGRQADAAVGRQPYRCYPAAGRDPSRGRQADAAVGRQPYRMPDSMPSQMKAKKISVRAIEPRYVKTKMFDACAGRMGVPASEARAPEDLAEEILAEIEAGREDALSFSRDRNVASPLGCADKGEAREAGRSD